MKTLSHFLLLLVLSMATVLGKAQAFPINVLPSTQCASSQGNSATGMVAFVMPGANSFSWSASGTGSCTPILVAMPPSGTMVSISYPCCGVYSITCIAFDMIGMPMGNSTAVSTIVCQPTVNVSVAPTGTLCSGATATLTATGANNYTWMPGNLNGASANVTPTASGCYTLVGEVNTCTSQAVKCLTVQGGAAGLSVTPSSPSVCAGSSIGLSASGATSYSWSTGSTTSSVQLTPSTSTTYTVIGNPGNCQSTKTVSVTVQSVPVVTVTSSTPTLCKGKQPRSPPAEPLPTHGRVLRSPSQTSVFRQHLPPRIL